MNRQLILFYSNYSNHSKELLRRVSEIKQLDIKYICIDNYKIRELLDKSSIKIVPTICMIENNTISNTFEGPAAFQWLDRLKTNIQSRQEAHAPPQQPPPQQPPPQQPPPQQPPPQQPPPQTTNEITNLDSLLDDSDDDEEEVQNMMMKPINLKEHDSGGKVDIAEMAQKIEQERESFFDKKKSQKGINPMHQSHLIKK